MDLDLQSGAELHAEEAQRLEAFSGINLRHVRGAVAEALEHFGRLGILEEYTKHNISHIDAMLQMYDWLIPDSTQELMTPADWLMITLATYLHDFGLLVTRDEFDKRDNLASYWDYRRRIMENDDPQYKDYRAQVASLSPDRSEEFLYQEYVRGYHAQRIRAWLNGDVASWGGDARVSSSLKALLAGAEEVFVEDVGVVCESHHLDDLSNTKKYPLNKPYGRTSKEEVNVQYAAFLLRTSDLLHITKDRVPSMAALIINPRNPKSQIEWAKQAAVRTVRPKAIPPTMDADQITSPSGSTVEVHATFKEAEGFFGLTQYLGYAAKQLDQTFAWSKENQSAGSSNYHFPWRWIDTSNIEARGFVAEPFEFTIDQAKILDLLTGHTLYNDTGVVVRELVQNALDAVRLQGLSEPELEPRIDVVWNSAERTLQVTDNGTGMTQRVIERNFLRVGSSRYQDPDFRKEFPDFAPISRFGIGVLSAFMVADDVSVYTNTTSEPEARQLSLRDVHGKYLVRLVDKGASEVPDAIRSHGTSVKLTLRPSAQLSEVEEILRRWVILPRCQVLLTVDSRPPINIGHSSIADALSDSLIRDGVLRSGPKGLLRLGAPVEVRTVETEELEMAYAVVWNKWLEEWSYVTIQRDRTPGSKESPPVHLGTCIGGIRVTNSSPGFEDVGLASLANAVGRSAPHTNVARSAIERTDEHEALLRKIYAGYAAHITREMAEFEERRASSITRAAQEADYLTQELIEGRLESPKAMFTELRSIPAIVVEEGGVRSRKSVLNLEEYSQLSTLEGRTIASLEGVLRSIRGAASASLSNILGSLGAGRELFVPDTPLVCGLSPRSLYSQFFTGRWQVATLDALDESRTLRATWTRAEPAPRWKPAFALEDINNPIKSASARGVPGYLRATDVHWIDLPLVETVEVSGFSELLVSCQGRVLVLPGHPFLGLKAAHAGVSNDLRLWAVAFMIATLSGTSGGQVNPQWGQPRGRERWMGEESGGDPEWVESVMQSLREAAVLEVIDEGSAQDALTAPRLEVFDVHRWDRRNSEEL